MNYNDPLFLVFFLTCFFAYYTVRSARLQIVVLIGASLFFYAWAAPWLLSVFLLSWLITALTSYATITSPPGRRRTAFATAGVVANLGFLALFKYKSLFLGEPVATDVAVHWLLLAPLPIGISFYTFHGISLVVDVYRGDRSFSREAVPALPAHLGRTLLYLVFFPQLIAGPIIKAKDFFPQLGRKHLADIRWNAAFANLVIGFFLKSVVADNLATVTFWIQNPYFEWMSSVQLVMMIYGYSFQIFADFAGYSLIAIGLAQLLGFELPQNFNFPYIATSIADFWRRWHMSLSNWLRDYLYIPLGGNRHGNLRTNINLLTVMVLGGLWHGAAWSFAVWGLWHGLGLVIERAFAGRFGPRSTHPLIIALRIFLVFNFVTFGWLLFKLQNFSEALDYLAAIARNPSAGADYKSIGLILIFGSAVVGYHARQLIRRPVPPFLRESCLAVMLFLVLVNAGPAVPFIYFQF